MDISISQCLQRNLTMKMPHSRINVAHAVLLISVCTLVLLVSAPVQCMIVPPVAPNSVSFDAIGGGVDLSAVLGGANKAPVHQHPMGEYPQCEWIPVSVCQGLGYNMTAMPNLIGHKSLLDAEIMVNVRFTTFFP